MESNAKNSSIKTICRFCGGTLSPRAKVCPHCGDPINPGNWRHAFATALSAAILFPMIPLCLLLLLGSMLSQNYNDSFKAAIILLLALSIFGRR